MVDVRHRVNPAKHNIFDFLSRDPRTVAPELSSAKVWPAKDGQRASVEMRRKSEPFWKILGRSDVKSTILRVPVTFPPEPFNGIELSAMCTPDLLGTQGTHSRFDSPQGKLQGPEGEAIPFIVRDSRIEIQDTVCDLAPGEYTPWLHLRFGRAHGIVRFLLVRAEPDFALYATPVQIDPSDPALPISHPPYYAAYLSRLLGTFATLGLAEDMTAMNEGAIDGEAFLRQSDLIREEREAMFFSALDRTRRGVIACVFDTTDRVQHMFFGNPAVIEKLYRDADRIVGRMLGYEDAETAVFVLSDHGFCSFRRGVNLNSWLWGEGYLVLQDGITESGDYFDGIDWTRTRAYTFGLGGLYLNLRGREQQGIVAPADARALKQELMTKLSGLKDESAIAIQNVYDAAMIYKGPYMKAAPDLVIGYADGYRASWDGAAGKTTSLVFEDNHRPWHGDHCVDPVLVPGVLFSNLRLEAMIRASKTSRPLHYGSSASIRRHGWKASLSWLLLLAGCGQHSYKKVIVVAVDGMDPGFVESHWSDLPNLKRLHYSRLATTDPPQSPVAWSTFATGLDPAQHGIFDFVQRDAKTGEAYLSTPVLSNLVSSCRSGRMNCRFRSRRWFRCVRAGRSGRSSRTMACR